MLLDLCSAFGLPQSSLNFSHSADTRGLNSRGGGLIQDKTVDESIQKNLSQSWAFANSNAFFTHATYMRASAKQPNSSNVGMLFFFKGAAKAFVMTGTQR